MSSALLLLAPLLGTGVVIFNCLNIRRIDLSGYFPPSGMLDRLQQEEIKTIEAVKEGQE